MNMKQIFYEFNILQYFIMDNLGAYNVNLNFIQLHLIFYC